jgi:hypothetical protein
MPMFCTSSKVQPKFESATLKRSPSSHGLASRCEANTGQARWQQAAAPHVHSVGCLALEDRIKAQLVHLGGNKGTAAERGVDIRAAMCRPAAGLRRDAGQRGMCKCLRCEAGRRC